MGYLNSVGDVFRHLVENASWPEGELEKARSFLDDEFPPQDSEEDEKPAEMTEAEKAAAYDKLQNATPAEPVSVSDQKAAGVPAEETVTVAAQRQGTPAPIAFVDPGTPADAPGVTY